MDLGFNVELDVFARLQWGIPNQAEKLLQGRYTCAGLQDLLREPGICDTAAVKLLDLLQGQFSQRWRGCKLVAILEATFLFLAAVNVALWAVLAGRLRDRLRPPAPMRLANRIGGSFLIAAGLLAAMARRTA